MKNITIVHIFLTQIVETNNALRSYGRSGNEGLVLWLGQIEDNVTTIKQVIVPPQKSIKSAFGVGYFVNEKTLYDLNRYMRKNKLKLIAQVHSHPGRAYHSDTDDENAIVTKSGGFSLVVPDFGFSEPSLENWAIFRLSGSKWKTVKPRDVRELFKVEAANEKSA